MKFDDPRNVLTERSLEEARGRLQELGIDPIYRESFGLKIIESEHMVDGPFEDWSAVRSPARARRRRRKGYPQRIRTYWTPKPDLLRTSTGVFIGHPATVRKLRERIDAL